MSQVDTRPNPSGVHNTSVDDTAINPSSNTPSNAHAGTGGTTAAGATNAAGTADAAGAGTGNGNVPSQYLTQSEQSKFIQHLAQYPALSSIAGLLASFPVPKILVSNLVPLIQAVQERSKPVTHSKIVTNLDEQGDKLLSKVDNRFPSLQKELPSVDEVRDSAKQKLSEQYRSVYTPSLDHRINNTVEPVNKWLRNTVDKYLPPQDEEHSISTANSGGLTNDQNEPVYGPRETLAIAQEAVQRAQKTQLIAKIVASLAAGKKVSAEYYNAVVSHFGSETAAKSAVDEVRNAADH